MMQSCPCMTSSPTVHVWGRFTNPMPFPTGDDEMAMDVSPHCDDVYLQTGDCLKLTCTTYPSAQVSWIKVSYFQRHRVCVYICTCVRMCVAQWVPAVTCLVIMAEYMVHVAPGQCLYLRCIWYPNWNCCLCCRWAHHCHNCRPTLVPSVIRAAFPIPPMNWLYLVCNWSIAVSMYA